MKEAISLLAHLTDTLTILITNLYISTGLLGIVLAMAIESCCIPLPSEIVMPVAGILIASGKLLHGTSTTLSLVLVALAGAIGCLIGSIAAYGIGYSGGRPLMLKYGRYVLISQHDADRADKFFQRWGPATAFFSRLLPVVRTYISLPAGIAKMPFVKFCVYSFLGSFPWCLLLAFLGVQLGNNLTTLSPIFHSLDIVIAVVVVVLLALYIWRHINNDRKARAHAAEQVAAPSSPTAWNQTAMSQQPQWGQPNQANQSNQLPQQLSPWHQQAAPAQPQWGQPAVPQQPQWGQSSQPGQSPQQMQQSSSWNQQPQQPFPPTQNGQNGWNQSTPPPTPSQFHSLRGTSEAPSQQQNWNQPTPPQWGQGQQPHQQGWPPYTDDDRTIRR